MTVATKHSESSTGTNKISNSFPDASCIVVWKVVPDDEAHQLGPLPWDGSGNQVYGWDYNLQVACCSILFHMKGNEVVQISLPNVLGLTFQLLNRSINPPFSKKLLIMVPRCGRHSVCLMSYSLLFIVSRFLMFSYSPIHPPYTLLVSDEFSI